MGISEEEILIKLNSQAEQFEMPVEDFVWDAIQKETFNDSPKKRGLFWWIFGVALAVLIAAILYRFNFKLASINNVDQDYTEAFQVFNEDGLLDFTARVEDQQNWSVKKQIGFEGKAKRKRKRLHETNLKGNLSIAVEANQIRINESFREVVKIEELEAVIAENELDKLNDPQVEKISLVQNFIPQLMNISPKPILNSANNNLTLPKNVVATNPISKKKSNRGFTLLFHAGLGESFRILNSGVHHDLISHKNDHESYGNCFEIGLDAQFKISKRFIGRTGIGYKFYSDKYDFQHDLITHTTRNDYQYFQMPFLLGFKALGRSKSKLFILGGVKANFLFSAQSSWVDLAALAPVAHSNNSTNSPFRNVTGAINMGLDYNYELTNQIRLHLIPSAETFVNSVYKRNTEINQRLFSFNLDVGISYTFK